MKIPSEIPSEGELIEMERRAESQAAYYEGDPDIADMAEDVLRFVALCRELKESR